MCVCVYMGVLVYVCVCVCSSAVPRIFSFLDSMVRDRLYRIFVLYQRTPNICSIRNILALGSRFLYYCLTGMRKIREE